MKITIDTESQTLLYEYNGDRKILPLYSRESFELISEQWLRMGWNEKYSYSFTWMGRPIIQLPEDMIRAQEIIYKLQPDAIIETGIAHGGSLIYYASICRTIGKGRVIGVDIEIRPHNRQAIERHPLFPLITLIEGDSIAPDVIDRVKSHIQPGEKTLIFLDSNHKKEHVLAELEAYHELISPGFYIVATDGIIKDLADVPRGKPEWNWNNPYTAAQEFLETHPEFVMEQPSWEFNESNLVKNITHWPGAWLRRK